jgi:hypothetical protein
MAKSSNNSCAIVLLSNFLYFFPHIQASLSFGYYISSNFSFYLTNILYHPLEKNFPGPLYLELRLLTMKGKMLLVRTRDSMSSNTPADPCHPVVLAWLRSRVSQVQFG